MPRVLIKESNYDQLENNLAYTIIISQHGFIIKQITNDESLESILITKIEPTQIKKFQLIEKNKEYILYSEFTTTDNKTYSFTMTSLELPVSILFDKIMKVIDPDYEEKSLLAEGTQASKGQIENQNEKSFLTAVDKFVRKTQSVVTQPFIQGLKVIQLGIHGIERTIKAGVNTVSKPFNKNEPILEPAALLDKEIQLTEFLIQVNKLFINHVDSALTIDQEQASETTNKTNSGLLLAENARVNEEEVEKPTAVLLHPFGLDQSSWRPYINYFNQKKYRVIAYDMRGWGGSEQQKNDSYKFSDYYDDLIALLETKGLLDSNGELLFVAASITGLMLLNKLDNNLRKRKNIQLILLSSSDKISKDIQDMVKKMPSPKTWGPLKKFGRNKLKEIILTKGIENINQQEEIISKLLAADNKVTFETLKNLRDKEYLDGLDEKQLSQFPFVKTLIILGEKDLFVSLERVKSLKEIPNVLIRVIGEANHFIAFEQPDVVVKEIDDWLGTNSSQS